MLATLIFHTSLRKSRGPFAKIIAALLLFSRKILSTWHIGGYLAFRYTTLFLKDLIFGGLTGPPNRY